MIVPAGTVAPDFNTFYTASNKPTEPAKEVKEVAKTEDEVLINDIPVVQAKQGETLSVLAARAGLSLSHFMKFNDLEDSHRVIEGGYYFVAKKKSKTELDYHKIKQGETLWQISQLYGVQIKRLKKYNHIDDNERLVVGDMLWLNSNKPRGEEAVETDEPAVELNEDKEFDWGTAVASTNTVVTIATPMQVQTHTVQAGETLYSISKQHQLSVGDLKRFNDLDETVGLKPGQVLKLTENEVVEEKVEDVTVSSPNEEFYEVKVSDTLYSVARQYGVTIKDLMECNNKKDFSVSVGERLKIPAK
ncbi:MAG: LysM peptidoglycan-binding domain-containing protein [Bacteroidota bacterium]